MGALELPEERTVTVSRYVPARIKQRSPVTRLLAARLIVCQGVLRFFA